MALVTNFEDRVIDAAGSLETTDNNAFSQSLADGCLDVIKRARMIPGEIAMFTKVSTTYTSDVSVSLGAINGKEVISVEREGRPARRIPPNQRYDITDSTSMYYITGDDDPVWYILDNVLYIKPTVDGGGAKFYYTPKPDLVNELSGENASSINDFPRKYYDHVVTYAIIERLKARKLEILNNPIDVIDLPSIPIIPTLPELADKMSLPVVEVPEFPDVNFPGLSIDMSMTRPGAMYWLDEEEDTELVTSALSIASKELEIYAKEYEKALKLYEMKKSEWDKEVEFITKNADFRKEEAVYDYDKAKDELERYSKEITTFTSQLTQYNNEVAGLAKRYDEKFAQKKQDYEWLNEMINQWTKNYEMLWGPPKQQQGGQ